MFLTNPTISELQLLDLPLLVEMLAEQTTNYVQALKEEGLTARIAAAKQNLQNIQAVIESKKNAGIASPPFIASPGNDNVQGIQKIS